MAAATLIAAAPVDKRGAVAYGTFRYAVGTGVHAKSMLL